jgi:hypothetical protein
LVTIIQIKAGASTPLELLRAHISQGLSETSTQENIQILRKSAAATVTSFTPLAYGPNTAAAAAAGGTAATGITATAEGTNGDILVNEAFNILNGWTWVPASDAERIFVPAAGIIAMRFPVAPASATWTA